MITTYGLHAIDFDLEEPEIESSTAIANELGAAQILQQQDPGLFISITIPSTTTGANYFGKLLLNEAKSLGFTPNDYTIMPFDGGFSGGSSQVTALQDFHSQLVSTFGWSSAQAYAHEGFSGMNGRTDSAEYFYQSDFQTVLSFAESNGLSRYTFWSVNRDRQCNPPGNNGNLVQRVQQRDAEPLGLHRLHGGVRQEHLGDLAAAPAHPDANAHPDGRRCGGSCSAAAWSSNHLHQRQRRRTTAASGPPTSGTTTRSRAARRARGTTTAPAKTRWASSAASSAGPGASRARPAPPRRTPTHDDGGGGYARFPRTHSGLPMSVTPAARSGAGTMRRRFLAAGE